MLLHKRYERLYNWLNRGAIDIPVEPEEQTPSGGTGVPALIIQSL